MAEPKMAKQGMMTARGPKRSSAMPSSGEATATLMAARAKAREMASRDQPKSMARGLRKMLNV